MILLIDNYDSFSYNLYQLIGTINPDIKVVRNDALTLEDIEKLNPEYIILSPGPGKPEDAGICVEVVKHFGGKLPILGVCLGHQSICVAYDAVVTYAKRLLHGKKSKTKLDLSCPIFNGCNEFEEVARYHSLSVIQGTLPDILKVVAVSDDGEVMAIKHRDYDVYGLQFHPESVMTEAGKKMIENFLNIK